MHANGELPHLPPGYKLVPVLTTYLEMRQRPGAEPVASPSGCAIERWQRPEPLEYLELFSAVGSAWGWSGRLIMAEEELKTLIRAGTTEVFRLRCQGETAGFIELDRGIPGQAEIAYFGLLPGFIGRGLGKYFLDWSVRRAWEGKTERVWLHTCEFDHPQALATYLKAGFSRCGERVETQAYPEEFLRKRQARGG